MISVSGVWRSAHRWAVVSNERAVTNARVAATECSRLRVERAEVEQFLSGLLDSAVETTAEVRAGVAATGR